MEIAENPYLPSILDVLVVKTMLIKGLHLPPELIDSVVDQAEYWPHSSSQVNYVVPGAHGPRVIGRSLGATPREENEFLLRSVPLGFRTWPSQSQSAPPSQGQPEQVEGEEAGSVYQTSVSPKLPGDPFPTDTFQDLLGSPVPLLTHPARKIVFTIRSHDQGWGGDRADRFTYNGSWTWFEAGLERWTREGNSADTSPAQQPDFTLESLSTVYPRVVESTPDNFNFDFPLFPVDHLQIQRNKTATGETTEHRVVWSYTDDVDPETDEEGAAKLAARGRGKATGNGKFVRELQLGDIVTVWGKTRFPGWANHVESVKVDVYWAV